MTAQNTSLEQVMQKQGLEIQILDTYMLTAGLGWLIHGMTGFMAGLAGAAAARLLTGLAQEFFGSRR